MTVCDLVDRLIAWLPEQLDEVRLTPVDGSADRAPEMVAGWLPPIGEDDEPRIPYIVVRAVEGQDGADSTTTTVRMLVATYAEDEQGWRDAVNVVQRIRGALTSQRTLGPHHLELPIQWTMGGEGEPLPQWTALITTTWTSPREEWIGQTQY